MLVSNTKNTIALVLFTASALGIIPGVVFSDDTAPPVLMDFGFSPTSVDVTSGSQNVTFTLRITDDVSGFQRLYCYIFSPSENQYVMLYVYPRDRISGDAMDGVYQVNVTFGYGSESGIWYVRNMSS
jgi:hypothetical protein